VNSHLVEVRLVVLLHLLPVVSAHVLVAPAPEGGLAVVVVVVVGPGAVAGALGALLDQRRGHRLQVVRPADAREEVDEGRGEVGAVVAQLGRLVVPREDVVVVVPALAERGDRHADVLRGADALVVGFHAPDVRRAVHQPRAVQRQHVPQHAR
jgi:hypothetical protein